MERHPLLNKFIWDVFFLTFNLLHYLWFHILYLYVLIFLDICEALNVPTGIILNPALENRFSSFLEDILHDFNKLTNKEVELMINSIHFLANHNK